VEEPEMQRQTDRGKDVTEAWTIADICRARGISLRTGCRERSAGRWPRPDFVVGVGPRQQPRWLSESVRRWLEAGGKVAGKASR
jgi:hypothetical protein